jgi:hypothetical protein
MKLGIMQPYFFPYLGYYELIYRTEKWIVFDAVKYAPKSWMNRNRILHPTAGWQYVSVPVDRASGDTIDAIRVKDFAAARERVLAQMQHYREHRAPHFSAVRSLVASAFDSAESDRLRDLNVASLRVVCDYLGIGLKYEILSEMGLNLPPISNPGQWALEISSALRADEYINPPGGRSIFVEEEFTRRNVKLTILDLEDFAYDCAPYAFEPHLSIIDVLMWNSPAVVMEYLGRRSDAASGGAGV